MADSLITISTPIATLVDAGAKVFVAVMNYSATVRASESGSAKDEEDHIRFQAYWDWRTLLQRVGIVGDPMPWPPAGAKAIEPPK